MRLRKKTGRGAPFVALAAASMLFAAGCQRRQSRQQRGRRRR